MFFYNDILHKACQINYTGGELQPHTIIHTHVSHLTELLSKIQHDCIICTDNGDFGIEYDGKYKIKTWTTTLCEFQWNPYVKHMFCTHAALKDPKVSGVPCGLLKGNFHLLEQAQNTNIPRNKLLYIKFNPNTHFDRPRILQHYATKNWATTEINDNESTPTKHLYFSKMKQHKFVLCPRGNGPDSYRPWEALFLGCYPIVPKLCHHYFKDLPILEVDNLLNLTPQFLESVYIKFQKQEWNWDMLTEKYWIDMVKNKAAIENLC